MKKNVILFAGIASSMLMLAQYASAHGHNEFKIGNKTYHVLVGLLNEPVAVDDKTGVDLRIEEGVSSGGHQMAGMDTQHDELTKPVVGLEKDLKVELIAGDKKKILDFAPAYNDPGAYRAYFIPTVETTYTFRVFGKINGIDVSLPFTCNPSGHVLTPEEAKPVEISPGVVQMEKTGAFGCPMAKADLGFPEAAVTSYDLQGSIASAGNKADAGRSTGMMGVGAGIIGIVLGVVALIKSRKSA